VTPSPNFFAEMSEKRAKKGKKRERAEREKREEREVFCPIASVFFSGVCDFEAIYS